MALLNAFFIVTAVRISNQIDIKCLFELFEVSKYFTEYSVVTGCKLLCRISVERLLCWKVTDCKIVVPLAVVTYVGHIIKYTN
jgi:hypothetical protein